jgi:hypothetical protein
MKEGRVKKVRSVAWWCDPAMPDEPHVEALRWRRRAGQRLRPDQPGRTGQRRCTAEETEEGATIHTKDESGAVREGPGRQDEATDPTV